MNRDAKGKQTGICCISHFIMYLKKGLLDSLGVGLYHYLPFPLIDMMDRFYYWIHREGIKHLVVEGVSKR